MEFIENCPICGEQKFEDFITCKDYTVTSETFSIVKCKTCEFKFTNPRPNTSEIGKYYDSPEYISHSNATKGVINSLYQQIRKYTIGNKVKLIEELSRGAKKTILDVGCGTGEFLNACKNAGWEVNGIEPGDNARRFSIENYQLNVGEEDSLEYLPANKFSIVSLWHVLEHVHDLNNRVQTLKKLLSNDGTLIIAVPNSNSFDADYYKSDWAAYDLPRHLYHFSPKNIQDLFNKHGLTLVDKLPMVFDAYYVSLLSEKYKKPSIFNYWNAFLTGIKSNNAAQKNSNNYSSIIYIFKKKEG